MEDSPGQRQPDTAKTAGEPARTLDAMELAGAPASTPDNAGLYGYSLPLSMLQKTLPPIPTNNGYLEQPERQELLPFDTLSALSATTPARAPHTGWPSSVDRDASQPLEIAFGALGVRDEPFVQNGDKELAAVAVRNAASPPKRAPRPLPVPGVYSKRPASMSISIHDALPHVSADLYPGTPTSPWPAVPSPSSAVALSTATSPIILSAAPGEVADTPPTPSEDVRGPGKSELQEGIGPAPGDHMRVADPILSPSSAVALSTPTSPVVLSAAPGDVAVTPETPSEDAGAADNSELPAGLYPVPGDQIPVADPILSPSSAVALSTPTSPVVLSSPSGDQMRVADHPESSPNGLSSIPTNVVVTPELLRASEIPADVSGSSSFEGDASPSISYVGTSNSGSVADGISEATEYSVASELPKDAQADNTQSKDRVYQAETVAQPVPLMASQHSVQTDVAPMQYHADDRFQSGGGLPTIHPDTSRGRSTDMLPFGAFHHVRHRTLSGSESYFGRPASAPGRRTSPHNLSATSSLRFSPYVPARWQMTSQDSPMKTRSESWSSAQLSQLRLSTASSSVSSASAPTSAQSPSPLPFQLFAQSHLKPGNKASLLSSKQTLELYRQQAKKMSCDLSIQYEFAVFLISVGANSEDDSELIEEGTTILKKLASQGHAESQYFLAMCYVNGFNRGKPDWDKAFRFLQQASKHNHAGAAYYLARCYVLGQGVKRDGSRAMQWYRKAAASAHPGAMYELAMAYLTGQLSVPSSDSSLRKPSTIPVRPAPKDGVKWLKRACDSATPEFSDALFELAALHERGIENVVFVDLAYAVSLYHSAAELGHVRSMFRLGECYEFGKLGCEVDPWRSITFYRMAAEKGHADSCFAMTAWYLVGHPDVVPQSDEEAFRWAMRAAELGHPKAMYAVAYFLEVGMGVGRNIDEAFKWYGEAAKLGDSRAIQRLADGGNPAANAGDDPRSKRKKGDDCAVM